MLYCASYVIPVSGAPITNGAVLVRGNKIADVGPEETLKLRYNDEEVVDLGRVALMPGFVDAHTCLEESVLRGLVHDAPFVQWLYSLRTVESKLRPGDLYNSALYGALDMVTTGITCVADTSSTGASARALSDAGMRGIVYREVGALEKSRVARALENAQRDIEEAQACVDASRVTLGIAAAPTYNCHPAIFREVTRIAKEHDLPVEVSVAGSSEEYDFVRFGTNSFSVHGSKIDRGYVEIPPWMPTGASPVTYLTNWDAFDAQRVLATYCVHVDTADIRTMKERNVAIVLCPRVNAQLGMGVAPMHEMLVNGLTVGLGTGSPAATESTDMFAEMRLGMLIQRSVNPSFITPATMLEMATLGGAKALGLENLIGSIQVGKRADLTAVDLSHTSSTLDDDPVASVVNNCTAADIIMTMIDGVVRFEKNKWHVDVDVAKNIASIIEIKGKLRA